MSLYLPNEDKRPRITCPHCKTQQILDIREFNTDMTKIAQFTCHDCKKFIYAGILLVANSNLNSLMQNIQTVIDAVGAKNTLLVGEGSNKTN